ncbi:hypothetical protein GS688_00520, partial [Rhodococcus hoagii]|nr:hypothetical protein [Prescottella equi]
KANRGREFEAALVEMLSEAKLQPRKGYRPIGEEIDGSFWLDGRTYLFEAKWTSAAHPASSLYQFKGKVEGKLTGTVGLFFSMSGYSPDAVQALVAGKNLNLVLFDDSDINLLFEEEIDIAEAIRLKVRAAAESGTPYIQLDAVRAAATRGRDRQFAIEAGLRRRTLRQACIGVPAQRPQRHGASASQRHGRSEEHAAGNRCDAPVCWSCSALRGGPRKGRGRAQIRSGRSRDRESGQCRDCAGRVAVDTGFIGGVLGAHDLDRHRILRLPVERVDVVLEKVLEEVDLEKQISLYPDLGPVLKAAGIPM